MSEAPPLPATLLGGTPGEAASVPEAPPPGPLPKSGVCAAAGMLSCLDLMVVGAGTAVDRTAAPAGVLLPIKRFSNAKWARRLCQPP